MESFLGSYQSRLDAKGRVSIPAPFRAALKSFETSATLIFRPSCAYPSIEVWAMPEFEAQAAELKRLDPLSTAYDDLATSLYAEAYQMEADREGRIVLPATLTTYAGLTDAVTFMGLGKRFEIWEPAAAEQRRKDAREKQRRMREAAAATQAAA